MKLVPLIHEHFPSLVTTLLKSVNIYTSYLLNGHAVTFSKKRRSKLVRLSITMDHARRDSYGERSKKDYASNQRLMPGTLDMIRRLRATSATLREAGYILVFCPIDQRRKRAFAKLLLAKPIEK